MIWVLKIWHLARENGKTKKFIYKRQLKINMIKNFKCKRCGECCISPRLYVNDIARIKKQGHSEDSFVIQFRNKKYMKLKNGKCVFLKPNKRTKSCTIYQSRPKICREYPIRLIKGSCKPEVLASDKLFAR